MKHVALLSVSLVALSGTAGLGLSALHEFNMNVQTSALATPDNIPADSGFVIPEYVPDAAQFTALAPALKAPVVPETPALAPVETAALGDFEITPEDVAPEASAPVTAPLAPAVREAIRPPAKSLGKTRSFKTAPVIVDQALTHTPDAATRIEYVIGVYR
ncbi:hypothetical protein [uncultured Tateyamaria sp.]|uniref:hypothetical protein n=1 Tax=uncultured Tateyamaria sp. TaxID=455651 RepID=UPI00262F0D62|nr:hypothetical protein [uncultured Tateyamaria sp.]